MTRHSLAEPSTGRASVETDPKVATEKTRRVGKTGQLALLLPRKS
jgi:hypothetical protein